jgi:hypothetical protein
MSSRTVLSRLALGGALASAADVNGAIVVFDTNGASVDANVDSGYGERLFFGSINLNGTFTISKTRALQNPPAVSAPSFRLLAETYYGGFYFTGSSGGSSVTIGVTGSNNLELFALNEAISSASSFYFNPNAYTSGIPVGTHYVGLRLVTVDSDVHYGWVELSTTGNEVFSLPRFAFNDVAGQSILAGQTTAVPEASTLGLVGGLFGLVAAAHVRRRRQQRAAASDKFLALAAGEKLN